MANSENLALNNSHLEPAGKLPAKGTDKVGAKAPATSDNGHLSRFVHDMKNIGQKPAAHPQTGEKAKPVKQSLDKTPVYPYLLLPLKAKLDTTTPQAINNSQQRDALKSEDKKEQAPVFPFEREKWNKEAQKANSNLDTPNLNNGLPENSYFNKFNFKNVPDNQLPTIIFIMDYSVSMFTPDEGKRWAHIKPSERPRTIDYAEKTLETICSLLPANTKVAIRDLGISPLHNEKWTACHCHTSELEATPRKLRIPGEESVYEHHVKLRNQLQKNSLHETPIPYALETAIKQDLKGITGKKMIVIISDGVPTCPGMAETVKRLANDPDAKDVDTNIFGIHLPKQKENEMKATADKLQANFQNMPKEDLEGAIVNRVSKFMGVQVLPSANRSFKVKNGSAEERWVEAIEP